MTIKILGSGCTKCKQLEANALEAVKESGLECSVEKVTNINDIMNYGVMLTPALAIDEEVKSVGKMLSVNNIKEILKKQID